MKPKLIVMKIRLTTKDKSFLIGIGYLKEDILQIARTEFVIELHGKPIAADKAIRIVGRNSFLSSVGRATFHWSTIATNSNCSRRVHIERAY